jgi:hypothetical protein
MAYLIGAGLAVAVGLFAWLVGFDRSRAFYPVVLIVVASYYLLFAVMGGSTAALWTELLLFAAFAIVAVLGFRLSLWVAAAGLLAHGLMDFVHGSLVENPGVPAWWPAFCLGYDVAAAAFLAVLLRRRRDAPDAIV